MMTSKHKHPEISVIMAVYNTDRYLQEAIDSILAQSFSNFEFVIVDDGSTDNSPAILDKYRQQDTRIKVITQKNAGIGAATQRAISESCGRYIVIMDSDDISLPQRLALQKQYLDQHPEIDAVGSQWRMLNAQAEHAGIDTHPTDTKQIETLMFAYFSLHHPTIMIRNSAIDKVGGYSVDRSCLVPDYDLFMRLQLNGSQFANLPEILFLWRLNPHSITRSKSAQQAQSVYDIRERGLAYQLENNPDDANAICKTILYNFPTGTWQDFKIQQLLPEAEDSLLYKTWLSLPTTTPDEQLYRTLILWLRAPAQYYPDLSEQLQAHKLPWLASLVCAHQGKGKVTPTPFLTLNNSSSANQYQITLFVPFVKCELDFSVRLQQAHKFQANSDLSIEVLAFSASEIVIPDSLMPNDRNQPDSVSVLTSPLAWEQALKSAKGHYFIYLEENFRFQIDRLLSLMQKTIKADDDVVYLLDKRYYTEAVNEAGKPLLDDGPMPKWNRSTLLGKDRLALSGFIHKRSLLEGVAVKLNECGFLVSRVLAKHLAIHNEFTLQAGALDYFIPAIDLNNTPLPIFQKTILDWYYDFGMSQLPAINSWSYLPASDTNKYAQALSKAWLTNNLILFPGNTSTIRHFYLDKVAQPMQFPLFKHLLVQNKKTMLITLWHKKKAILFISVSLYYLVIIVRNRISGLFIK